MSDEEKRTVLFLAADCIENYCAETGCGGCVIKKLCNALGKNEPPLADQIRRMTEQLN